MTRRVCLFVVYSVTRCYIYRFRRGIEHHWFCNQNFKNNSKQWRRLSTEIFFAVFVLYPTLLSIFIICILLYNQLVIRRKVTKGVTRNNQRLRSAGDNDRRAKRFCSSAVLCVSFTRLVVKTRAIRLRVIEGPNARDQSAFCGFHTFLVEVQTNAGHIHATCAY